MNTYIKEKEFTNLKQTVTKSMFIHIAALGAITICLLAVGCKNKQAEISQAKADVDTLAAFVLKKQIVSQIITLPSQLEPFEKAELFAKIPGYIRKMNVDIGDRVNAGQTLAIVEAAEYNANLSQSVAAAQSAQAKYQSSRDAYDRLLNASREPGAIAEGELVKAKSQMLSDSAAYIASKQASAAYSQINNYLVIKAPFTGVVTQRNADPGDLVNGTNAKPILIVENNSTLRLKVPVPETYTDAATETKDVTFTIDAIPDNSFSASIYRKSNTIDLSNRTELWEFLVKNNSGLLRSGMYANVSLPIMRKNPSFTVPYSSVATTLERNFVIKVQNGESKWVDVRNGINMDKRLEIFGNLNDGDTLLVKSTDEIKPNQHLVIKMLPAESLK